MQLENRDAFCASCHTEGEVTFVKRASAAPVDLASYHASKKAARCIDCHSGAGIVGRYVALTAGASDIVSFVSGHYDQPAVQDVPIPDKNCLKCHSDISESRQFNNHFHAFLPQWQAQAGAKAAICTDCHDGHDITNDAGVMFLNNARTVGICQRCHAFAGGG